MVAVRRRSLLLVLALAALMAAGVGAGQKGKSRTVKKQLQPVDEPEPEAPEVQLPLGWLSGRWMQTRSGRRIAAFTKVPFAQPPLGGLRFKAPVPVEPWGEPARESPPLEEVPACMQAEDSMSAHGLTRSEDCLYLNVFSANPVNGSDLPVLVWLYGGSFQEGAASLYGPEYLLDRDLVLVTPNYRVGPFGFLSTGDAASTGNWGLKDQQLALRWVKQNIRALGGDPDRVTLVGQSAGGVSVHTHVAARSSKGLFHRAVSLGGCALSFGLPTTASTARRYATRLAARLGCPESPSADLVSCLREKPAADLVAHEAALRDGGLCPFITWAPVVEDFLDEADKARQDDPPLLEQHPIDAMTSGLALDVPWLAGFNLNEGGLWVASIKASKQLEAFDAAMNSEVPLCFGFNDTARTEDLPEIMEEIREFYLGANNVTKENLHDLAKLFTDGGVLSSVDEAMRLHAAYSAAPAYLYLFSHRGQRSFSDLYGSEPHGVVHADELLALFPMTALVPAPRGLDDAGDRRASEQFIDLLLNFAEGGDPTPVGDERYTFPWQAVENEDLEFLEIAQNGRLLKGAGLFGHRAHFWSALPLSERNIRNMRASSFQTRQRDEF